MDSSWLAFSLSNINNNNINTSIISSTTTNTNHNNNSNLSLFQSFSSVKDDSENGYSTDPKLEDFLGHAETERNQQQEPNQLLLFSNASTNNTNQIYDSDLKTIAASFLRGFNDSSSSFKQPPPIVDSSSSFSATAVTPKKPVETFGQRTSIYRGVTRHRWTGRYEAHLWDNSCRREGQSRKGRQVYLGGYDKEEKAARAYDLAALKYWGPTTTINFPISTYEKELEDMKNMTRQEFVASLRRKSSGFSRGASIYRGVTRHHQHGRWQARIGRVAGNKDLYLGTFSTQEEAAEAYDIAAIKFRGPNAVTNFDMNRYDVKSIANSNLPIGGTTTTNNKTKTTPESPSNQSEETSSSSTLTYPTLPLTLPIIKQDTSDYYWSNIFGYSNSNISTGSINNVKSTSIGFTAPVLQNQSSLNGSVYVSTSNGTNLNTVANGYEMMMMGGNGGGSNGSWITQSLHNFDNGKGNLSVFQTPIYGME